MFRRYSAMAVLVYGLGSGFRGRRARRQRWVMRDWGVKSDGQSRKGVQLSEAHLDGGSALLLDLHRLPRISLWATWRRSTRPIVERLFLLSFVFPSGHILSGNINQDF
jgi:hypothetical protein